MILIDLQKTFGVMGHVILLQRRYAIVFSKHSVKWFQSYFINRTSFDNFGNIFSQLACVSSDVLQGYVFGHPVFLIYVNDLSQAVKCNLFLYAENTCLISQYKEINETKKQLNDVFENICDWSTDSKPRIYFGNNKTILYVYVYTFCS